MCLSRATAPPNLQSRIGDVERVRVEDRASSEPDESREAAEKNLAPVVDGKEYCPGCGRPLQAAKCKLVCECGYFMSCSDF